MGKRLRLVLATLFLTSTLFLSACADSEYVEIYTPTVAPAIFENVAIEGDVSLPGIYPLKTGDTVEGLLQAAGGVTGGSTVKLVVGDIATAPQKINLNTAAGWLTALPGVGDTRAAAIIDYRNTHGPFVNIMELMKVSGFGQVTFDSLKDLITVSG